MKAIPLQRIKQTYGNGIVEIAIWQVSEPVPPCTHSYKYRLVYIVAGDRWVGYDNERGKGDHCHADGIEKPYRFVDIVTLIRDFYSDVDNKTR